MGINRSSDQYASEILFLIKGDNSRVVARIPCITHCKKTSNTLNNVPNSASHPDITMKLVLSAILAALFWLPVRKESPEYNVCFQSCEGHSHRECVTLSHMETENSVLRKCSPRQYLKSMTNMRLSLRRPTLESSHPDAKLHQSWQCLNFGWTHLLSRDLSHPLR